MKKLYLVLALPLFLIACKKSAPAVNLSVYLQQSPTDSLEIEGHWILLATRHYSVSLPHDTTWAVTDTVHHKAVIGFGADKTFTFNDQYAWQDQQFDRYRDLDSGVYANDPAFFIYASVHPAGNIATPPTFARLRNPGALIITYMGVDTGDQELYIRTSSGQ